MFSRYSVTGAKGKEGKEGACALDVEQEGNLATNNPKQCLKKTLLVEVFRPSDYKCRLQSRLKAACGCEFSGENLCSLLSITKVKANMFPCCLLL